MRVINARNVNDAYAQAIRLFHAEEDTVKSCRPNASGSAVIELGPVTTVYRKPCERILWDTKRDANPFFHLFESLWMLAGRNDVDWLTGFAKNITDFSDEHGAYGFRWRNWFGFDQIVELVKLLKRDPSTRRAVLTMWSPNGDLATSEGAGGIDSKDVPCNLMIKFERRNGPLDMMVFNRSNDMIFGAYGANAVHFSMLQEVIAGLLGVPVGIYWQVSANFHVYQNIWESKVGPEGVATTPDLYDAPPSFSRPNAHALVDPEECGGGRTEHQLGCYERFCQEGCITGNTFLDFVAMPLFGIWCQWKQNRALATLMVCNLDESMPNTDWIVACRRWMERRIRK